VPTTAPTTAALPLPFVLWLLVGEEKKSTAS